MLLNGDLPLVLANCKSVGIPSIPAPPGHSWQSTTAGCGPLGDVVYLAHPNLSFFPSAFFSGGFCGAFCFQKASQYRHTECFPAKLLEIGLVFDSQWVPRKEAARWSCPVAPSGYLQTLSWQILNGINGGNHPVLCVNTIPINWVRSSTQVQQCAHTGLSGGAAETLQHFFTKELEFWIDILCHNLIPDW